MCFSLRHECVFVLFSLYTYCFHSLSPECPQLSAELGRRSQALYRKMATPGTIQFQEKVGRLLSKRNGKPVLKPNRTLALKDTVTNQKSSKGEATCVPEMYTLMACWKQNNFVDSLCSIEMDTFYTCVKEAQAAKNRSKTERRLTPNQAMSLLKRFPNPRKEI